MHCSSFTYSTARFALLNRIEEKWGWFKFFLEVIKVTNYTKHIPEMFSSLLETYLYFSNSNVTSSPISINGAQLETLIKP